MIICCDIDNILNDLTSKTIALYNKRHNSNITIKSVTTYDFSQCLGSQISDELLALFNEKELWDSLVPLSGSQKGLKTLYDAGHTIYLATATAPINFAWKCDFIKKYFPFVSLDNVIRIKNKSLLIADVIIDDCIEHLVANSADRVCLTYPWNINPAKDFIYDICRCQNWDEIIKAIKTIERRNTEFYE